MYLLYGIKAQKIAELFGVSERTLRRRMEELGLRWRIVIHGGTDGFSRLIVYLSASTNNQASTVLNYVIAAVNEYGLPSRVRSDKAGENFGVAEFMVANRGEGRNSHITGRSVHNQSGQDPHGPSQSRWMKTMELTGMAH
ncbi:hypothetical protein MHYP_G00274170 [Metynnis hypsauchen]